MINIRINNKGGAVIATTTEQLASEIQSLTDVEKLHLVDTIIADLDRSGPELDRIGLKNLANGGPLTKKDVSRPYLIRISWTNIAAYESAFKQEVDKKQPL